MSHAILVPDELYRKVQDYAARSAQEPDALIVEWVEQAAEQAAHTIEEEADLANDPLFQVAGMFASNEPGWVDRHDEYLADEYGNAHADE